MRIKSIAAAIALGVAASASANPNLVSNGSLELSDYATPDNNHAGYEFGIDVFNNGFVHQGVTDWAATLSGGISFYYFANSSPSTRPILNRYGDQQATLAASYPGPSPDGGNFAGFDSDYIGDGGGGYNSPFVQTINGLDPSKTYHLTFYWAATQLQNRHGPTTDYFTYGLGGDTRSTNVVSVADQGFVGWKKVNALFNPTSSSETLHFLAFGTPAGLPPFALLDGVSLSAVPEPETWALLIAGFGMVGTAARRRSRAHRVAA